ncbi:ABC transporter permease [Arsenicitalea aurantiaca]|nr:iron ABC transporter permease [Arsenicitalea aurantiaca]
MTDLTRGGPAGLAASPARIGFGRRLRLKAEDGLGMLVVLALIVLVLGPMATVLVQAFWPGMFTRQMAEPGFSGLLEVFSRPLWQRSLTNSLFLAAVSAVAGGLLGTVLAVLRHSTRMALGPALDIASWAIIVLPSFILAQGWILFASRGGIANQWLGWSIVPDMVFNPWGLAAVMSLKAFPFAYLTVSAAMQWRMDDFSHAAKLCGASPLRVLATIQIPMLVPAVLSGAILIFIDVLGDFGLPAALATTYRFPTLTYAIYVAINQSPIRFDLAGVLAFYVTGIMLLAVMAYFWILRNRRYDFLGGKAQLRGAPGGPRSKWSDAIALVALGLAIVVPLGSSVLVSFTRSLSQGLAPANLTLEHYGYVLQTGGAFLSALGNSMGIAVAAALASGVLAAMAAYVVTFSDFRLNRLIDLTCTLSLAVPGVVLGIGYIFVWNSPALDDLGLALYGKPVILVLAGTAGAVPIAVRVLLGAMAQVPASMLSAAAMQGAGLARRLATIVVPIIAAALVSATLTAFGSAVFDLAINSILRPPRLDVLPVYVNRAFEQGMFGAATAATLVAGGTTILVIVGVRALSGMLIRRLFGATTKS